MNQWKNKVVYQIFPRSFYDENNDGSGDIRGIIAKLDYLQDLGINAIWLCPIYDTEFIDAGYDVLNYKKVWKQFGTLSDFENLAKACEKRNISIVMDIVLNHTSNKHEWFKKAIESVENKEHNYYIWRDKPTKAKSIFGGPAWEYNKKIDKYYFHLFTKEQVDLNWKHPDTIKAMADVIDFWYKLGVRGFRLDAIQHVWKDFVSNKVIDSFGTKMVETLQEFNKVAFKDKKDLFIMGEASGINPTTIKKYGIGREKIASNFFNFSWWTIGWGNGRGRTGRNDYDPNWKVAQFLTQMQKYQSDAKIKPELTSIFLTNHDTSRAISRWGDENIYWKESAKALAMLQFSLKGIPIIYYGEEIGMLNPHFEARHDFRDVDALNSYKIYVDKKKIYSEDAMTKMLNMNGRDNSRTPFQWDDSINAGFNKGQKPWIKVGYNHQKHNLKSQINDSNSIYNFYKKIISLRKKNKTKDILLDGLSKMSLSQGTIIKISRTYKGQKIVSLINLSRLDKKITLPKEKVLLSSYNDFSNRKIMRPYEAIMYYIKENK